jgi:hypothetical protein
VVGVSRTSRSVRALALLSTAGLLTVLALVGVVATVAELNGSWSWYLRMEKAISASTPVALGLAAVTVVALFGLALVADR